MSLRRLATGAALGVVAWRAAVAWRRSRPLRLGLRLWVIVVAADWLDDLFDDLGGLLGGLLSPVAGFVKRVARAVVARVTAIIDFALGIVWWVIGTIQEAVGLANTAITNLRNLIASVVGQLRAWVEGVVAWAVGGAIALARTLVDGLREWVGGWVGWLVRRADAIEEWVRRHVLEPLSRALAWVESWVRTEVVPFVVGLWREALALVEGLRSWIGDRIAAVWDFIDRWATPLLRVVDAARDWLVFMATHPFTWWRIAFSELIGRGRGDMMDALVRAMQREGDRWEEFLIRWID